MNEETKALLKEKFDALPSTVQEAILGTRVSEAVQAIGKKRSLLIDQVGSLETEVMLLLVGLSDTEEFPDNLRENLEVSSSQAEEITGDVNDMILEPIRQRMLEATEEEDETTLTRESILREIESPSPARFTTAPAASLAETHNDKVLGKGSPDEVPVHTEPLASLPLPIDPSHELSAPAALVAEIAPVVETSIAPTPAPPAPPIIPVAPSIPITQAPRTVTEIKPAQPEKRRTIDPYREPLE